MIVGDIGMNSSENRRMLSEDGGRYILGSKMQSGKEVNEKVLALAEQQEFEKIADNLFVTEVIIADGGNKRRYVVCYNPSEAERQAKHREKLLSLLMTELQSPKQSRGKNGHSKRSCKLLTSKRFARYLKEKDDGCLIINNSAVQNAARYDGKWVITSNDDSLTPKDLALGYKQLLRVEQCWRTMKSGLKLRPVYHRTGKRIESHIKLCVLALLLERIAEIRVGDTWRNIAAQLDHIQVAEYMHGNARMCQTTELRDSEKDLLNKLGVPLPPRVHTLESK